MSVMLHKLIEFLPQAITWTNVDQVICCNVVSLENNVWTVESETKWTHFTDNICKLIFFNILKIVLFDSNFTEICFQVSN